MRFCAKQNVHKSGKAMNKVVISYLMSNMSIIYGTLMFQELFKSYLLQVLLLGLGYRETTVLGTVSGQKSKVPYVLLDSFQS